MKMEKRDLCDWSTPEYGMVTKNNIRTEYWGGSWHRVCFDAQGDIIYRNKSDGIFWYAERDSVGKLISWYTDKGRIVYLADVGYVLKYHEQTCVYKAGCRKFSWREALKHWDSSHHHQERATKFRLAIQDHLAEKSRFEKLVMLVKAQWCFRHVKS
jgi:hypothetical protein